MSRTARAVLAYAVVAGHPFTWGLLAWTTLMGPQGARVLLAVVTMDLLLTLVAGQVPVEMTRPHDGERVEHTTTHLDGWSLPLREPRRFVDHLALAGLTTLAPITGWVVVIGVSHDLRDLHQHIDACFVVVAVLASFLGALHALAHLSLLAVRTRQARATSLTLHGRRLVVGAQQVHLSGASKLVWGDGVVTVRDGDEAVVLRGPSPTLRWIADQIEAVEPLGDAEDVPEALRHMAAQSETP